jgi:hypothetical protein
MPRQKKGDVSMQIRSIFGVIAAAALASPVSAASAETLNLTCKTTDGGQSRHLMIDLDSRLVSNEASGSGRSWAARITGNNIIWDEVFDSRIGHISNHYVFDRDTGTLHRTDMTGSESGREVVNAVCQKAS